MFIVFEGGEGVGKTTQIEHIFQALKKKNFPTIKTREPGGTPFAEKIRSLFKEKCDDQPTPQTELFLICAARAQHMEKVILPQLSEKKIVLCDRFLDSTYVYQHCLGHFPKEQIDTVHQLILKDLVPDLTFIFHCDQKIAQQRMRGEENRKMDRFDTKDIDFQANILNSYKKIYETKMPYPNGKIPTRILLDASQNIELIFQDIKSALKQHLGISL